MGTNNFLNSNERVATAASKLEELIKRFQLSYAVKLCPLFELEKKQLIIKEFNERIREIARKMDLKVCSIRGINYKRDIGDCDLESYRLFMCEYARV